jgi:predicted O-methyltransferase YrrM
MSVFVRGCRVLRKRGLNEFLKQFLLYSYNRLIAPKLYHLMMPYAIKNLKELSTNIKNIEDAVELAYSFKHLGISIQPLQIREEIIQLLRLVEVMRPKNVLEIGTSKGGTLFLFTHVSDLEANIISVDLPDTSRCPEWKTPFFESFAKEHQRIYLIKRDSHNPETVHDVKKIIGDTGIDFCFIDGDHSYDGVKKDFEIYSPLMAKDGIIAFHDIVKHPNQKEVKVDKFWEEIKSNQYRYSEFVTDWNQNEKGIGILHL